MDDYLRALAHARHEINQQRRIAGEPQQDRHREPAIGGSRQRDGRKTIDQNVPDRGDGRGQGRAHRRPGLHHPIGNAAGEIVLKERPALPHHVPVRLPANEAGERRGDRLVGDEVARQRHRRAHDQEDDRHAEQPRPAFGQKLIGRRLGHHGDDAAHEPRHCAVGQRDEQFDHEQRREQPLRLAGEVPQERNQPARRLRVLGRRRRRQESFEKCKHLRMVTGLMWEASIDVPTPPGLFRNRGELGGGGRAALRHDCVFPPLRQPASMSSSWREKTPRTSP